MVALIGIGSAGRKLGAENPADMAVHPENIRSSVVTRCNDIIIRKEAGIVFFPGVGNVGVRIRSISNECCFRKKTFESGNFNRSGGTAIGEQRMIAQPSIPAEPGIKPLIALLFIFLRAGQSAEKRTAENTVASEILSITSY